MGGWACAAVAARPGVVAGPCASPAWHLRWGWPGLTPASSSRGSTYTISGPSHVYAVAMRAAVWGCSENSLVHSRVLAPATTAALASWVATCSSGGSGTPTATFTRWDAPEQTSVQNAKCSHACTPLRAATSATSPGSIRGKSTASTATPDNSMRTYAMAGRRQRA